MHCECILAKRGSTVHVLSFCYYYQLLIYSIIIILLLSLIFPVLAVILRAHYAYIRCFTF